MDPDRDRGDAELRAELVAQFAQVNAGLQRLGNRLAGVETLLRERDAAVPAHPARPDPLAAPAPTPPAPTPPAPAAPARLVPAPPVPLPPRPPRRRLTGEEVLSRVFAVGGGGLTLVAIALLLVMGVQRGVIGPGVRVAGLVVLSSALVLAAVRVRRHRHDATVAVVLAAVASAGFYLTAVAVTTVYGWVAPLPGSVAALLVALAALGLARAWDAQALAVATVAGVGATWQGIGAAAGLDASVVAAFVLLLVLVTAGLLRSRPAWTALAAVALPVLWLYQLGAALLVDPAPGADPTALTVVVVAGSALLVWGWAAARGRAGGAEHLAVAAALFGVPLLVLAQRHGGTYATVLLGCAALVPALAALGARWGRWTLSTPLRSVFWSLATVDVLALVLQRTTGTTQVVAVLVQALLLGLLARAARTRTNLAVSLGVLLVGLVLLLDQLPPAVFWSRARTSELATWPLALSGALLLLATVSLLATAARVLPVAWRARPWWLPLLPVAWYALVAAAIVTGTRLFRGSAVVDGFLVGIMAATLLLAAASFVLLARFVAGRPSTYRTAGLLTLAVAAGKVVLVDTTSLDTLYRVGAYLGTGLLLLGLGAAFGRRLTAAPPSPERD